MDPNHPTRFDTEILGEPADEACGLGWATPSWESSSSAPEAFDPEELFREMARLGVAPEVSDDRGRPGPGDGGASDPELQVVDLDLVPGVGAEPVPGYRLLARIGVGGSGEVWKALGPGGVPLALKFLRPGVGSGPAEPGSARSSWKARRDGLRSLELMREVRHPNVLPLFGAWQRRGQFILGMELADGTLLGRIHDSMRAGLPGIPFPELIGYMRQAAQGIDFLNEPRHALMGRERVGIQHRDIKPQNLLLVGGCLKLADFGLARLLEEATAMSCSMTPAYAAPEFFGGRTSPRSDQYSLAVTYCQARGGRLPFAGDQWAIMAGHCQAPPDLAMLPPAERPPVARALAKAPEDRWPDCLAFVEALAAGGRAAQDAARPDRRRIRRAAAVWMAAGVPLLATLLAIGARPPRPSRPSPAIGGAISGKVPGHPPGVRGRTPGLAGAAATARVGAPPGRDDRPAPVRRPVVEGDAAVATKPPVAPPREPGAAGRAPSPVARGPIDATVPPEWAGRLVDRLASLPVRAWLVEASRRSPRPDSPPGPGPGQAGPPIDGAAGVQAAPPAPRTASIHVVMPDAKAELVVRGEVGRGNPDEWYGPRRIIHTPPFASATDYLVGAFWTDPTGSRLTRSRRLRVEPGRSYEVDLRAERPTAVELKRPAQGAGSSDRLEPGSLRR